MPCKRGAAHPDKNTTLRLFSASAGYCQNPSCLTPLFREAGKKRVHVAEMAHIFAAEALSFAGENRPYVEQVASGLKNAAVEVFYDEFEKAALWGKNLVDHFADIYQKNSRYVVMFISEHYVRKAWPQHERHAQARALLAKEEYILPARFDDTEVPGMTNTVGHVDLRTLSPSDLVNLILAKLGQTR